ncbi:asparaginase [Ramlibacter sp. 2FC]|uniref:asparaginase n=1 Tax=Ramlibacter sp. 2FC TaxID=2502188 RepID=UPI0010F97C06|nr:asparaginase [Ramlibacter sp. 2FC]
MKQQKIVVLGTGGTIAGKSAQAGDNIGYQAAQLGVAELLDAVPGLPAVLQDCELEAEQVAQVDSKDMDFGVWQRLALRCEHWLAQPEVRGLVITHGTDTLEETAYFLQAVLAPDKPVVLACAMRPATALLADGPQNLLDAFAVALAPSAHGVLAVCAGQVHGALDVRKSHTYRLDAFDSGEAGPVGQVEEARVRWLRPCAADEGAASALQALRGAPAWPRVEIVMNYAGAGGAAVDALVQGGVQGLVVAGTGNGSLHHELEAALQRAQAGGVRVLRTTRCAYGRVLPKPGDALAVAQGLSPVKARVAMLLSLLAP